MKLSKRSVRRLKSYLVLVAASALGGPLYGLLFGLELDQRVLVHTLVAGLIGGALIWGFELLLVPGRRGAFIRRMRFIWSLALRVVLVTVVVSLVGPLAQLIVWGEFDPLASYRLGPALYLYVLAVVFVLFAMGHIVRIIGPRVLFNILTGRYRHPVREKRIFLFLDIRDSTPLSQQLGDIGVQDLITRFFFDIADPVLEWGGEIHGYVGDAVIVTWSMQRGVRGAAALNCCFAIQQRMQALEPQYQDIYGLVPRFRIGLHGGPVVTAQCGDVKQEITYFGDTINTAARIQDYCKQADCDLLISAELLDQMPLSDSWNAQSIGPVHLRGREQEMELYAVQGSS